MCWMFSNAFARSGEPAGKPGSAPSIWQYKSQSSALVQRAQFKVSQQSHIFLHLSAAPIAALMEPPGAKEVAASLATGTAVEEGLEQTLAAPSRRRCPSGPRKAAWVMVECEGGIELGRYAGLALWNTC